MRYKCVVSDLDLTLLQQGDRLSEKTKVILGKLGKKGILFVPASGRPLCSYPEDVLQIQGIRYIITSNGAMIYDLRDRHPVWCSKLPGTVAPALCKCLRSYPVAYEAFIDGKAYASEVYWQNPELFAGKESIEGYVQRTREPVADMERFLEENKSNLDGVDVVVRQNDKEFIRQIIQKNFRQAVYITSSASHLIEISNMDSGKHQAVARLVESLDITMDEVVAFGDGENDCELLRTAGLGIAVENAVPDCHRAADWITGTHHADGVADALTKIFHL